MSVSVVPEVLLVLMCPFLTSLLLSAVSASMPGAAEEKTCMTANCMAAMPTNMMERNQSALMVLLETFAGVPSGWSIRA